MDGNQVTPEEREALLVEYQVCEQDNAANFQGFWTLAAIFFGLSSVFLAGLIYAVIANESLFSNLLSRNEPQTLVIGIIGLIIGIANVVILKKIKGWHRRIMFNQGLNLGRMREIELDLEMRRWWRTLAIDEWNKIPSDERGKATSDQKRWSILYDKLKYCIDPKYHGKLDERKDEILELLKHYFKADGKTKNRPSRYEPSSSTKHFPWILYTLMSLWVLVISAAVFVSISLWNPLVGIVVAILVLITYVGILVCDLKRSKTLETI